MGQTAHSKTSQAVVLDPAALDQLRALQRPGRPNLVERVLGLFRTDGPQRLASLRSASAEQDWERLRREAHTLKSSAANIGAQRLREACGQVEADAKEGRYAEAVAGLEPIERCFAEVLETLASEEA
ncbi:MAG: Hpt domain-containing protein [Myxococcota bacterium]